MRTLLSSAASRHYCRPDTRAHACHCELWDLWRERIGDFHGLLVVSGGPALRVAAPVLEAQLGVRIGLLVLTIFAAFWAWAAIWLSGAPHALVLLPIGISLALLASGWRGTGMAPTRGRHVGRVVGIWSAVEGVALFLTANVLVNLHRADLMLPAGALIVGLHFFPLARGIPARVYTATGAGLVLVAIAGFAVPASVRPLLVGLGAALVLWGTALAIVLQARRLAAASPSPSTA
jgi:hypothetical protein